MTARSIAPAVRRRRHDPSAMDLVDEAQPVEVLVDQDDLGLHARGDPRRVPADVAGAEHDDLGRTYTWCPTHQYTSSAVVPFEVVRAHLRCEAAGDLAHWCEQWQRAVGQLHRLVGDGRRPRCQECLGHGWVRRQVEIGEEGEVVAEECVLRWLRLLDLDDHLLRPGVGGRGDDVGARSDVVVVGDRRSLAGAGLDQHLDAVAFEFANAVGCHRDAMLGGLHFSRHANGANNGCGGGHCVIMPDLRPVGS